MSLLDLNKAIRFIEKSPHNVFWNRAGKLFGCMNSHMQFFKWVVVQLVIEL